MHEETVVKSSTLRGSSPAARRWNVGLHPLSSALVPVRTDPQGKEGWELLGLLREAAAVAVERRYARGEVIFEEGDPGNALYVLTEGAVKLCRGYAEGKEATVMLLGTWEVFGELTFGCGAYQYARAEALTACRLRKVPKVFLERVVKARPEVALKMMDLRWLELVRHREMAECILPHKAESKLAKLLPILGRKFGEEEEVGRMVIRLRLTQEELAKMISSTRESVTHALTHLRRRGALALVGGHMVILDPTGLEHLASGTTRKGAA
jgi:CRP-like cAMP-binding protein